MEKRGNLLPRISTEVSAATDKTDREKEKGFLESLDPRKVLRTKSVLVKIWVSL